MDGCCWLIRPNCLRKLKKHTKMKKHIYKKKSITAAGECACVVSVWVILCNLKKKLHAKRYFPYMQCRARTRRPLACSRLSGIEHERVLARDLSFSAKATTTPRVSPRRTPAATWAMITHASSNTKAMAECWPTLTVGSLTRCCEKLAGGTGTL